MAKNKPHAATARKKRTAAMLGGQIQVGTSPGTIREHPEAAPVEFRSIAYGPKDLHEEIIEDVEAIPGIRADQPVRWLRVVGGRGADRLERLSALLEIPGLAIEDALNRQHRPKVERFPDALFVVLRTPGDPDPIPTKTFSIWLTKTRVVTFEPEEVHSLDGVLDRIRRGRVRLREGRADYLAYALMDTLIDGFFPVLEAIGERFEALEAEIMTKAGEGTLGRIYELRRDVIALRRASWPQRDLVSSLIRDESDLLGKRIRPFLEDCHDHAVLAVDSTETLRDLGSSLMELHLSSVGHRQNEVMKVLTIFSAVFIPLSFVAGLYGMNFDQDSPFNMPELGFRYGYPLALMIMAGIAGSLLIYFRRKGWIGKGRSSL
ncbi:MAG: magnesium/cobalt transporter CorA [Planctomycetota bacterium]